MAGNARLRGQSVTSKVAAILHAFGQGSDHSLTQIAVASGLATSTTHRLAQEMVSHRILERTEDGKYRAGACLQGLGQEPRAAPDLRGRGPGVVDDLAEATGLRCRLGILRDLKVRFIEKTPGRPPITSFEWGASTPVHASALGRAMLAYSPREHVELVVARGLFPYTAETVIEPSTFRRELAIVRATGVAVIRGELTKGVDAMAVPVFGGTRHPLTALEVTMPAGADPAVCLAALTMASTCLSADLAGRIEQSGPADVAARRLA